jgi:putative DNA primase/helicase
MSIEAVVEAIANAEPVMDDKLLEAVTIHDLLAREFPPREWLLEPAIPSQGLVLLYGPRGQGKTLVAMGIAYAVASGGEFLKFKATKTRKVLYVDGEMPAVAMQDRCAALVDTNSLEPPTPEHLLFITPDIQEKPIPDLSTAEGQREIERHLEGVELLILDNLSCLCRYGRENEGESWLPVQEWMLSLRKRGISVLFIHHAGKGGQQRGTSRREDVLDTVLALKRPGDYLASEGARFEIHYEKSRGAHGDEVRAFEAQLNDDVWSVKDLSESRTEKVAALLNEDIAQKDIADMLSIDKGTVSRHAKKARTLGLVTSGLGA